MANSLGDFIYIGSVSTPSFSFDADTIYDVSIDTSVDVIGMETRSDTMEIEVEYNDTDSELRNLAWATPVFYFSGDNMVGKFYSKKVIRTGTTKYRIECTSALGILDYEKFYGGLYTGQTFSKVVNDILWTNGITSAGKVYDKLRRGFYGYTSSTAHMYAMSVSGSGLNYMTCGMKADFVIHSCLLNSDLYKSRFASETSLKLPLLGAILYRDGQSLPTKEYGMYMEISRPSVNVDWPDFGTVYFAYGPDYVYMIGTPYGETSYSVDVDPYNQYAKINGVRYTISPETYGFYQTNLGYYGGGGNAEGYTSTKREVACDITYGAYQVWEWIFPEDGEEEPYKKPIYDFRSASNARTENTYFVIDTITGKTSGNLFYGEGVEAYSHTIQTINDYVYDFANDLEYAAGIADLTVYGWLPVCTKREAFHQLMFAKGVSLLKSGNGKLLFTSLTNSIAGEISNDDLYIGGTAEFLDHTNTIEVTEHSYTSTSETAEEESVLYENKLNVDNPYMIEFSGAPVEYNGTLGDIVCYLTNCNAAFVAGIGKIMGYPYLHEEKINRRQIGSYGDGKTVSVSDATLVTLVNSEVIADKLEAYYGSAYLVKNGVIFNEERTGNKYTFKNPFSETASGFLAKASLKVSSIIRSDCEFAVYDAPEMEDGFNHYVILSGSGIWTVPDEVLQAESPRIRAILIGGGNGGSSGYAGQDGEAFTSGKYSTEEAAGGDIGNPGNPGKVYDVVIDNPASTISYSCGTGGSGGAVNSSKTSVNAGSNGGNTTLTVGSTTYSSASGNVFENGYVNLFTGAVFAKKVTRPLGMSLPVEWGGEGTWNDPNSDIGTIVATFGKGGKGGHFESVSGSDYQLTQGQWSYAGNELSKYDEPPTYIGGYAGNSRQTPAMTGGLGGGSAWGARGSDGQDSNGTAIGNGGDGADATLTPVKPTTFNSRYFGYGGCGGAGGGGGGSSGAFHGSTATAGTGGLGGKGGKGGDGGDGCVIIYY